MSDERNDKIRGYERSDLAQKAGDPKFLLGVVSCLFDTLGAKTHKEQCSDGVGECEACDDIALAEALMIVKGEMEVPANPPPPPAPPGLRKKKGVDIGCEEPDCSHCYEPVSTREVEVIVCITYGGESGPWHTEYVEVPADTPEDKLEQVAREKYLGDYKGEEMVTHVGLYNKNDDGLEDGGDGDAEEDDGGRLFEVRGYRTVADYERHNFEILHTGVIMMSVALALGRDHLASYEVVKVQDGDRTDIQVLRREDTNL